MVLKLMGLNKNEKNCKKNRFWETRTLFIYVGRQGSLKGKLYIYEKTEMYCRELKRYCRDDQKKE